MGGNFRYKLEDEEGEVAEAEDEALPRADDLDELRRRARFVVALAVDGAEAAGTPEEVDRKVDWGVPMESGGAPGMERGEEIPAVLTGMAPGVDGSTTLVGVAPGGDFPAALGDLDCPRRCRFMADFCRLVSSSCSSWDLRFQLGCRLRVW